MSIRDVVLLVLILAATPAAAAQAAAPATSCTPIVAAATGAADSPLDRPVTLHAPSLSLRDALARITAASGVRIAYSGDVLPLERRVCIAADGASLRAVLERLLDGVAVVPVVVGATHVVLAGNTRVRAGRTSAQTVAGTQQDTVVVALEPLHAHTAPAAARGFASTGRLIDGATLTQQGSGSLANALNGTVPGLWLWHEGSGLLARFGSMRGASSFGATAPKIYVDGIELANPLLLARLTAESVEWIEVISGPQGAALYGANAMAGVLNIRTRHDAPYDDGRVVRVHSGVGLSSTAYAPAAAVTQGHGVNVAARAGGASAVLNVATSSLGDYAPDAAARDVSVDFSGRLTGGGGLVAASARFVDANGGTDALSGVRQLTAGITAALHRDARWVHTATIGIDGFTALGSDATGVVLPGDAPLPDHGAVRGSVRLASSGRFALADVVPAKLSLAVEHSVLRETAPGQRTDDAHATTSNTGVTVQGDVAFHSRLLVHAGLRFDHDGGFLDPGRFATLPMLSSSWAAIATEPVGVSLRAAYGRAIRWPEPRYATMATRGRGAYVPVRLIDMRPEEQTGVEAGVDVRIGRALTLQVTHFDQTASVLAQPRSGTSRFSAAADAFARARSDVGEIDNTGWELQAGLRAGALALNGTLAFVDSRVGRVAAGYAGDLRTGDRMLEVPGRTFGITASWTAADWAASLSAARASDWVGYDRAALAAVTMGTGATGTTGAGGAAPAIVLRDYRVTYDGFTHIGASLSRTIRSGLVLTLSGDNLLNVQRGEPDNLTVVPGRTLTLGARATLNALR